MSDRLPIGVMLPVFNGRAYVARHLAAMREWAGLVEEIVVVDSYSDDGTLELLKEELRSPLARFVSHPRGLYQSWNFGIRQITAKYTYVSTLGDVITRAGLEHLFSVAEQFQSDVVVSRPRFATPEGQPVPRWRWPIDDLIQWQSIERPAAVAPVHVFLLAALDAPKGILGSSASNLYRTGRLHRHPFPTEYGHVGDTAWAIRHAFETAWAVTPAVVSEFLIHQNAGMIGDEESAELVARLLALARQTCLAVSLPAGEAPASVELASLLELLAVEIKRLRPRQLAYDTARDKPWPWIMNHGAWRARHGRNRQRERIDALKTAVRIQCGLQPASR